MNNNNQLPLCYETSWEVIPYGIPNIMIQCNCHSKLTRMITVKNGDGILIYYGPLNWIKDSLDKTLLDLI